MIGSELLFPVGVVTGLTMWMGIKYAVGLHQAHRQHEIVQKGVACKAKVVAIQRPFMLDTCTRLYFDFEPPGAERPLRGCHVDRRLPAERRASLPAAGALVIVRYLPKRPREAVISQLVRQLSSAESA